MKNLAIFFGILIFMNLQSEEEFSKKAIIESIRKDQIITLVSSSGLENYTYLIFSGSMQIGICSVLSQDIISETGNDKFRITARYSVKSEYQYLLNSGNSIGLVQQYINKKTSYPDKIPYVRNIYRTSIITPSDGREMVFVKEGKIKIGSNTYEKDEFPQHIINLDAYYIDKFEVSNKDYSAYLKQSGGKLPLSWKGSGYPADKPDHPVMVTYFEALQYAKWVKKELPTEFQWEKAANGISSFKIVKSSSEGLQELIESTIYPWGDQFDYKRCNSIDIWNSSYKTSILNRYEKGLLPNWFFQESNVSAYGAVNMSGNAAEWTSSWYDRYNGNHYVHKRFGRHVKVIKGGGWYSTYTKTRISSREFGGLPDLYTDNSAGFRCIKVPSIEDLSR